jgi:hypothetical protein
MHVHVHVHVHCNAQAMSTDAPQRWTVEQVTLMVLHWLKHRIARETKDKKVRGKREWSWGKVAIAIVIFGIIATAVGLAASQ